MTSNIGSDLILSSMAKDGRITTETEELLHKLHIVADYEGRSANSEILILIRNAVAEYERENGKIEL